ncbi:hypothetical protein [Endozoicomonas sp. ONNA1]|uniref:hypothetical protein n=1 Tax=Endozoicomonas sp. ONNA1 TaxID=2828740 RepID=UPI002148F360|nr:hypothetical protein [Endozoicomonas sp. ONNA1]
MDKPLSAGAQDLIGNTMTVDDVKGLNDDMGSYLFMKGGNASDMFHGDAGFMHHDAPDMAEGGGNRALGYFAYSQVIEPAMKAGKEEYSKIMDARADMIVNKATEGWGDHGAEERALFSALYRGDIEGTRIALEAIEDKYSENGVLSDYRRSVIDGMVQEMTNATESGEHAQISMPITNSLVMSDRPIEIEPSTLKK